MGGGPSAAARLTLMNCMSSLVFFSMCCSRSPWNVCTCVERRAGAIRAALPFSGPSIPCMAHLNTGPTVC